MLPCHFIYFLHPVLPQNLASLLFHCKCTRCTINKTLFLTEVLIRILIDVYCILQEDVRKFCLGLSLFPRRWAGALGVLWARQRLCEHTQGDTWLRWGELKFACKVLCKHKFILLGCLLLPSWPTQLFLLYVAVHSECSVNTKLRPQCLKSIQETLYTQVEWVKLFLGIQ